MTNALDNRMLLFNEMMVSAYLYMLFCLTDFMIDIDIQLRDKIGLILFGLVILTVAVNLFKALYCFKYV